MQYEITPPELRSDLGMQHLREPEESTEDLPPVWARWPHEQEP